MPDTTTSPSTPSRVAEDHPVYWLLLLVDHLERGDLEGAVEAQRELKRLGYLVRVAPPHLNRRQGVRA